MDEKYTIQPIEEMRATVFDSAIDLSMDISEICIDMLQDDNVVKDIPILGSVYKVGKICYSVGQLAFIKKVLVFAQEMQRNDIGRGTLEKHKKMIMSNPKKYYKELEIIIEYIDKQIGCEKSKLYARVYYLYLNEQMEYADMLLLWEIIEQVYLYDIETLLQVYQKGVLEFGESCNKISCRRLSNCALVDYYNGMIVKVESDERSSIVRITELGKVFCEAVLQKDDNCKGIC